MSSSPRSDFLLISCCVLQVDLFYEIKSAWSSTRVECKVCVMANNRNYRKILLSSLISFWINNGGSKEQGPLGGEGRKPHKTLDSFCLLPSWWHGVISFLLLPCMPPAWKPDRRSDTVGGHVGEKKLKFKVIFVTVQFFQHVTKQSSQWMNIFFKENKPHSSFHCHLLTVWF